MYKSRPNNYVLCIGSKLNKLFIELQFVIKNRSFRNLEFRTLAKWDFLTCFNFEPFSFLTKNFKTKNNLFYVKNKNNLHNIQ